MKQFSVISAKSGNMLDAEPEYLGMSTKQQLQVGSTWKLENLSVFKEAVRTNNDVEGYHRRLNERARRGHLPFYMLIRLLNEESLFASLQVKLLSEGKVLKYKRRKYTDINCKLALLWEEYEEGRRSTSSLLRKCSHLQLPTTED